MIPAQQYLVTLGITQPNKEGLSVNTGAETTKHRSHDHLLLISLYIVEARRHDSAARRTKRKRKEAKTGNLFWSPPFFPTVSFNTHTLFGLLAATLAAPGTSTKQRLKRFDSSHWVSRQRRERTWVAKIFRGGFGVIQVQHCEDDCSISLELLFRR